jgi:hypothetical protein
MRIRKAQKHTVTDPLVCTVVCKLNFLTGKHLLNVPEGGGGEGGRGESGHARIAAAHLSSPSSRLHPGHNGGSGRPGLLLLRPVSFFSAWPLVQVINLPTIFPWNKKAGRFR